MIGGIIGVYWTLQEAEGGMTREGRPTYKSGRPIDQTSQFASCHSTIVWTRGPTTVCNSTLEDFDSVWLLAVALSDRQENLEIPARFWIDWKLYIRSSVYSPQGESGGGPVS